MLNNPLREVGVPSPDNSPPNPHRGHSRPLHTCGSVVSQCIHRGFWDIPSRVVCAPQRQICWETLFCGTVAGIIYLPPSFPLRDTAATPPPTNISRRFKGKSAPHLFPIFWHPPPLLFPSSLDSHRRDGWGESQPRVRPLVYAFPHATHPLPPSLLLSSRSVRTYM